MNNLFVYIETEGGRIADVSLELMTKGRELAATLGVKTEAVVIGHRTEGIEEELARYGAETVWVADDEHFAPFRTLPHTAVLTGLIRQEQPQIVLFGATSVGRDLAPRVSSALHSGLRPTARNSKSATTPIPRRARAMSSCSTRFAPPLVATSSPRSSTPTTVRRWQRCARVSCHCLW